MHRIDEIKRRLSVLENRLTIKNEIIRGESLFDELNRRLHTIEEAIKSYKKPVDNLKKVDIDHALSLLTKFEEKLGITSNLNPDAPQPKESRPLKYEVNFLKSIHGNAIRTGSRMLIKIRGAKSVSCGIYKDGALIMVNQSHKNDEDKNESTTSFLLKKRRVTSLGLRRNLTPGTYELKTWFYLESTKEQGMYKDQFEITP